MKCRPMIHDYLICIIAYAINLTVFCANYVLLVPLSLYFYTTWNCVLESVFFISHWCIINFVLTVIMATVSCSYKQKAGQKSVRSCCFMEHLVNTFWVNVTFRTSTICLEDSVNNCECIFVWVFKAYCISSKNCVGVCVVQS